MQKVLATLLTFALLGSINHSKARAQDLGGALNLPMLGQSLTLSASIRAQAERDAARQGRSLESFETKRHPTVARGSTRFRVSKAVRQQNLALLVGKVRQTDPKIAAQLQQNFAKSDPITAIAPALRRYNLRTDDVADAATAYLVSAWYGVRGRHDDPRQSYINGVKQQMHKVLLSVPSFVSSSNKTKQQMAEAMLVQLMINEALIAQTTNKPELLPKTKSLIGKSARIGFKLDLTKLKLTTRGLHA